MERYSDKYIIVKDVKVSHNFREFFDDGEWSKRIPIAIVDSIDAAQRFIYNKDNLVTHLKAIDDGEWEVHPDTNENHRSFYSVDNTNPLEEKCWFVKFYYYRVGYYK